jgi:hypothetical protein
VTGTNGAEFLASPVGAGKGLGLTAILFAIVVVDIDTFGGTASSRSSIEKSRSWVESGGRLADIECETLATEGDGMVDGTTSDDSSRAICVPLSRKSSQLSVLAIILGASNMPGGADLEAGNPGSLKAGVRSTCVSGCDSDGQDRLGTPDSCA